ncbi:octanoyltransferase [Arenicella chitinivorans]|uniref:Octanoyltransferase n=1 Tax=Arenicella chitinivorans TaxID=1329800 RepID=A0A918S072_9GAMM|nr:lipoyl(octanoyl) transferase LipB [Arenicella chitinivorans]GHA16048.1 octanoyltransferase [Arenicella chitinivorans]
MTVIQSLSPRATRQVTSGSGHRLLVREFGLVPYEAAYQAMCEHVANADPQDLDEVWLVEHAPVYTQGTACQLDPLLPSAVPVVKTDRGGQITYHGPGQMVMYPLLRLKRYGIGVKSLVHGLEQCVIDTLSLHRVKGDRRDDAPGVYVDGAKIAALGLRIRRGMSYHGLSFNLRMDMQPFKNIDPCGYQGLVVTQLSELNDQFDSEQVKRQVLDCFLTQL